MDKENIIAAQVQAEVCYRAARQHLFERPYTRDIDRDHAWDFQVMAAEYSETARLGQEQRMVDHFQADLDLYWKCQTATFTYMVFCDQMDMADCVENRETYEGSRGFADGHHSDAIEFLSAYAIKHGLDEEYDMDIKFWNGQTMVVEFQGEDCGVTTFIFEEKM